MSAPSPPTPPTLPAFTAAQVAEIEAYLLGGEAQQINRTLSQNFDAAATQLVLALKAGDGAGTIGSMLLTLKGIFILRRDLITHG